MEKKNNNKIIKRYCTLLYLFCAFLCPLTVRFKDCQIQNLTFTEIKTNSFTLNIEITECLYLQNINKYIRKLEAVAPCLAFTVPRSDEVYIDN